MVGKDGKLGVVLEAVLLGVVESLLILTEEVQDLGGMLSIVVGQTLTNTAAGTSNENTLGGGDVLAGEEVINEVADPEWEDHNVDDGGQNVGDDEVP